MAWQVLFSLSIVLLVSAAAASSAVRTVEGTVSINSQGSFDKRIAQLEHERVFSGSPGLKKLMEKLGFRAEGDGDEKQELPVRKTRRKMRTENLNAEEGAQLEGDYDQQFPLRDAEKSDDALLVDDSDASDAHRDSRRAGYAARNVKHSRGNVMRKHWRHPESQLDDVDHQAYRSNEDEEARDEEDNRDLQDESEEEDKATRKSDLIRIPNGNRRKSSPQIESDLVMESEGELPESRTSRRNRGAAHKHIEDTGFDHSGAHAHVKQNVEAKKSGGSQKLNNMSSSDMIEETVSDATVAGSGLSAGENVRAYHFGLQEYENAKVAAIHKDGMITVDWDSGDIGHRTMNSTEVSRPHRTGDDSPYRFDGPNAYDMLKEQENRVSGHALTPSTRTNKKRIFDGYTLFPPSSFDE